MSWFVSVYHVLFFLHFNSYESQGKIISPPDGTNLTIVPGGNDSITWSFDDDVSTVGARTWSFTSTDGLRTGPLGAITLNLDLLLQPGILPGITITKPATLALNNVNQNYDGTYRFSLVTTVSFTSTVRVFIAKKPNVILNCSSAVTVHEGDNFTCVCRSEGGNPPADVTWYKGGKPIGTGSQERKTLTLSNISRTSHGLTYECEARSHSDNRFADKKSIKIEVNYPPEKPDLNYDPKSLTITCDGGKARPPARFEIFVNKTKLVMKGKTYTIPGTYTCDAVNILGRSSSLSKYIFPCVPSTTCSPETSTKQDNQTVEPSSKDISCGTEWYIVVVSVVAGFVFGIFFSYIVWCLHHKFSNKKSEWNSGPKTTETDTTYQELDVTKMNKEDNYQSLRGNAAANNVPANDDESTYTELSKTKDEENNYQSLA